jgi:hypothetical protein
VFDVVLNGDLTIASDLDIFERVGRGVAFDEYVEFEVKDGKILYEGDESEITAGKMRVEFIKVFFTFRFFDGKKIRREFWISLMKSFEPSVHVVNNIAIRFQFIAHNGC